MIQLPVIETEATKALCLEIAKKSKGVCLLLFSRGKDSLFAWLYLKKFFQKVIPIHCTSVPLCKHVADTLDYYERMMETKIIRMVGEEVSMSTARGMYQLPDDLEDILDMEVDDYSKLDILEEVRYTLNLPRCWCAVGINAADSIDRRIYCKKTGGKNENNLTFYPTWDIKRSDMIEAMRQSGLALSGEYKWANRTLGGVPSSTVLTILRDHYPEDYERMLQIYPLCQAKMIRERYLNRAWAERKAMGIEEDEDEGVSSRNDETGEQYETDDGSDAMSEFGMGVEDKE